jgi:hypothetical protein
MAANSNFSALCGKAVLPMPVVSRARLPKVAPPSVGDHRTSGHH